MTDSRLASPRRQNRKSVATDDYPRGSPLSGRAYPIRFECVWAEALRTAGAMRGWTVAAADARTGDIRANVVGRIWKRPDEVSIQVTLDEVGLTRVAVAAAPVGRRIGRAASRRRIGRYLRVLDRSLAAAA